MPQNHLFNLKNDFGNVQMTEILQLINLLKKIPSSQIYQDFNKKKTIDLFNTTTTWKNKEIFKTIKKYFIKNEYYKKNVFEKMKKNV